MSKDPFDYSAALSVILQFAEQYADGDRFDSQNFHDAKAVVEEHEQEQVRRITLLEDRYRAAVDAASPILQCGGSHAHLVPLGKDILVDGVPALAKALVATEKKRDELKQWAESLREECNEVTNAYNAMRRERDELKRQAAHWEELAQSNLQRAYRLTRSKPLHYDITDDGIRICTGEHDRDQPCEWANYVEREKYEEAKRLLDSANSLLDIALRENKKLEQRIEGAPRCWLTFAWGGEVVGYGIDREAATSHVMHELDYVTEVHAVPVAEVQEPATAFVGGSMYRPVQEKEAGEAEYFEEVRETFGKKPA